MLAIYLKIVSTFMHLEFLLVIALLWLACRTDCKPVVLIFHILSMLVSLFYIRKKYFR
jgi:integral membrane sensor domain MASE1